MNIVLAVLTPATANREGLIFSERICCPKHWLEYMKSGASRGLVPIGKTEEYCSSCAEAELELMNRIKAEPWYAKLTAADSVYISGPMSGRPNYNREAFWKMEHAIKPIGCRVLSPAHYTTEKTYQEYMRLSMDMVFKCTHVVALSGYGDSKGAIAEIHTASALGKQIFFTQIV